MSVEAYLGLGANLGRPADQLRRALALLAAVPGCVILRRSRFYRTEPVGRRDQPWFVNGAVRLATSLAPAALLDACQAIETELGRRRMECWGPRVIDLDILLYGDLVLATDRLVIPHPEIARRRFVLQPLADLTPGLVVPGLGRSVGELLAGLPPGPAVEPLAEEY